MIKSQRMSLASKADVAYSQALQARQRQVPQRQYLRKMQKENIHALIATSHISTPSI